VICGTAARCPRTIRKYSVLRAGVGVGAAGFLEDPVWDRSGQVAAWSRAGMWTMGVLRAADWHAALDFRSEVDPLAAPVAGLPFARNRRRQCRGQRSSLVRTRPGRIRAPTARCGCGGSSWCGRGFPASAVQICGLGQYELTLNGPGSGRVCSRPAGLIATRLLVRYARCHPVAAFRRPTPSVCAWRVECTTCRKALREIRPPSSDH